MRRRIKRGYVALMVMIASIALFLVTMASPVISTTTDFSIYNSGWNGTSGLAVATYEAGRFAPTFVAEASGTDATIVHLTLQDIDLRATTDTLVIVGPSKEFTGADGDTVGAFVRGGGVLILADDFGTGNGLLESIGASSRFSGKLLMDLSFDKRPEFSVLFTFADDPLTDGVSKLLLNHPSSIAAGAGVEILAESSVASWLDTDSDSTRDLGEPKGPFPVLARETLGDGTVILLSDPSVLINGMVTQLDNGLFADNLVAVACEYRTSVFFDESHREYFDPIVATSEITGEMSLASKLHILLIAFALLVWVSTDIVDRTVLRVVGLFRKVVQRILALFGRRIPEEDTGMGRSREELVAEVAERHPDWRLGLIRHIVSERERHGDFVRGARRRKDADASDTAGAPD